MTEASIEASLLSALSLEASIPDNVILPFKYIIYIYYLMRFKKKQAIIQNLIDSGSKINIKTLVYVAKLISKL